MTLATAEPPARSFPSDVAWHEANHAAALCLAGLVPHHVNIYMPDDKTLAGENRLDWGDGIDDDNARPVLLAAVVGALTEGHQGWDDWPINPDAVPVGARRDAEHCLTLAHFIGIDSLVDWLWIRSQANKITRDPQFRRLAIAIARALDERDVLYADDLKLIMEQTP